jgi:hypothetical protein
MKTSYKKFGITIFPLLTLLLIYPLFQSVNALEVKLRLSRTSVQTSSADEEEIKRVVHDSQFAETLVIYGNPKNFDRSLLTQYWVPVEKGGKALEAVLNAIRRLVRDNQHYSKESENELFDIRSVRIEPDGNSAVVRTRERWYVLLVDENEKRVKGHNPVLEYPVRYTLIKMDGRWLIETNSTKYRDDD